MKRFMLLHYGFETPTKEIMNAWNDWFGSIEDKLVDHGSSFKFGRAITHAGTEELILDRDAITGYSVIEAENLDEAEKIAKSCPFITGIRVYELRSM